MKRFLRRSAIFMAGILVYCLTMVVINQVIFALSTVPLHRSRVLIAGDSHLMRSLDPSVFEDAQNICRSAESYAVTYWKLQQVLDVVRPDTVILSLSPANLSSYSDRVFDLSGVAVSQFNDTYRVLNIASLMRDFEVDEKALLKVFVKRLALLPNLSQRAYVGHYLPSLGSDTATVEMKYAAHFARPGEGKAEVAGVMITYLDSIVALCRQRDIVPVVTVAPHLIAYIDRVPSHIMEAYADKLATYRRDESIPVVDRLMRHYPDSLYLDADHLNHLGATAFTREVIAQLREPMTDAVRIESR